MAAAKLDPLLETLQTGKTTEDRLPVAEAIAAIVAEGGPKSLKEMDLFAKLVELMEMKKKPGAREGAACVVKLIAETSFDSTEAYLIDFMPTVLDLCGDKMKFVGEMSAAACKTIIEKMNPYAAFKAVPMLISKMGNEDKWQTHVAALNCLGFLMLASGEQVNLLMPQIVPKVAAMMWEMKQEVKDAASSCLEEVCGCIDNRDIEPFIPALISCIQHPDEVQECVHLLAGKNRNLTRRAVSVYLRKLD